MYYALHARRGTITRAVIGGDEYGGAVGGGLWGRGY